MEGGCGARGQHWQLALRRRRQAAELGTNIATAAAAAAALAQHLPQVCGSRFNLPRLEAHPPCFDVKACYQEQYAFALFLGDEREEQPTVLPPSPHK
jgi:hypothetical protein